MKKMDSCSTSVTVNIRLPLSSTMPAVANQYTNVMKEVSRIASTRLISFRIWAVSAISRACNGGIPNFTEACTTWPWVC